MTYRPATISDDLSTLPQLPGWVTSGRVETLETVSFRSGAAITVLDQLVSDPRHGVPVKLLANRLALSAATASSKLEGRLAREADIRDAYHLTPPGEARGPDGDRLAFWREGVRLLAGRTGEIADFAAGVDVFGERFLDEHVASAPERFQGHLGVAAGGREHVDDRGARVDERLQRFESASSVALCGGLGSFSVEVDEA